MESNKFIFCLEAVADIDNDLRTEVLVNLESLAVRGIDSIYKTCDTIEGLQDSLNALLYDDHGFADYEIIYLIMQGEANNVCINDYFYSLEEIAEVFEGRMTGKILHFGNAKPLDLTDEEAQYFLDITGARAISGYGIEQDVMSSSKLDAEFFSLCQDRDDLVDIVELLHSRFYDVCRMLDFRMYY